MIESIEFKNFKCLRDTTLPLGPCTILVGPNGSGKSTVLDALEAFRGARPYEFSDLVSAGLRGNMNVNTVTVIMNWGEPFKGVRPIREWHRDKKNPTHGNAPGSSGANQVDPLISRVRIYSLDAKAIAASVKLAKDMELGANGAAIAGVLTRLQDRERERFEALNRELFRWLPEFDQIQFDVDAQNRRVFMLRTREGHHTIPAACLSQGTLIALAILTLAYLPDPPSLIGLEEPDRGVHPYLLRHVQDALYRLSHPESCGEKRDPVQVIATTHSPYFLDLFKDHPEEIVVANKVGLDVQFQRLTNVPHFGEMLGDATLGEAWYTGFLGGVPTEP